MAGENGAIDLSHEGIEIWNRTWSTYKERLFPEDKSITPLFSPVKRFQHDKLWPSIQYWFTPANTELDLYDKNTRIITVKKPVFGIRDVFKPGTVVMDIGCGGGSAAIGMAREFKKTHILATDYELGKAVSMPTHREPNLEFKSEDWRSFTFSDNSFDAFVSDQGIARYGNTDQSVKELTRIAKVGAVFRGTQTRGIYGQPNFHDRLAMTGWDVWQLRYPSGSASGIIIAQLKNK